MKKRKETPRHELSPHSNCNLCYGPCHLFDPGDPACHFSEENKKCVCAIVFVLCSLCGAGGYDIPGYIAVHGKFGGGDCRLPRGPGIGLEKQRPSYRRAVGDSRGLCDGAAAVLPGMTCLQIAGTVIK